MVSKYLESVIIGAGVGQSLIFPSKLSLQFAPYVHTVKKLINHPYEHSSLCCLILIIKGKCIGHR